MIETLWQALQPAWPDLASFLRMGRHGAYVWPALGLFVAAPALELGLLKRRARRACERREDAAATTARRDAA